MNVNLAESSIKSVNKIDECPICKAHDYRFEPSDELLEAIREVENGKVTHCENFEDYLIKINE